MADKTIEQRIKDIIIEQLGVTAEQVTPEAKFIVEFILSENKDGKRLRMMLRWVQGTKEYTVSGSSSAARDLLGGLLSDLCKSRLFAAKRTAPDDR
jgi:hypothetical protein